MLAKMDNHHRDSTSDKNSSELKNTEWLPTKCRITKPPPPKPATNPLQFIKVAPCPLFQQAHEQIKKVEEIKVMRQDIKDEAEDWQQNLDNWKSSRRKRQEHIIERVVEVKKLEQEEQLRGRRKNKTFSEILRDRDKRGHRVTIPIYDDDSNYLSDYGIGSCSSKANSVKDVDTDDSSSILDDKDQMSDSQSSKNALDTTSNQSQSEDELNSIDKNIPSKKENNRNTMLSSSFNREHEGKTSIVTAKSSLINSSSVKSFDEKIISKPPTIINEKSIIKDETPQYTYEGAIEDYRSRIRSKINIDESIFTKESDYVRNKAEEVQKDIPKVDIFKRKEVFEFEKPIEINHFESNSSKRLSEAFANTQSIRDRLKSLEKCVEQPIKSVSGKGNQQTNSIKSKILNLNQYDSTNNNVPPPITDKRRKSTDGPNKTISYYLLNKSSSNSNIETKSKENRLTSEERSVNQNLHMQSLKNEVDCYANTEAEMYMNKLNLFNRDLDNFYSKDENIIQNCTEDSSSTTTTTSTSFGEFTGTSSDREDSGIHTADVSCSVSQADEPIDDTDLSTTIPNCIEKLHKEKDLIQRTCNSGNPKDDNPMDNNKEIPLSMDVKTIINITHEFLDDVRQNSDIGEESIKTPVCNNNHSDDNPVVIDSSIGEDEEVISLLNRNNRNDCLLTPEPFNDNNITYENLELRNYAVPDDIFTNADFALAPVRTIEPPKEKPPPPPPLAEDEFVKPREANVKRLNSTKRIKKEINIKRSSFLGLDEPSDDFLDPEIKLDQPPDINMFLKRESQLEKSLYKKLQGNRDLCLSEVESQDSGLESEKGRLSSDTWCSSTPTHVRQDSEQTISVTSEEDEITKKEREIIELIEKEEKCRDPITSSDSCSSQYSTNYRNKTRDDGQDSEVLKVEYELLQLEREELERQRENALFRERVYQNNRHSLENLCNVSDTSSDLASSASYRKSMPELQKDLEINEIYNRNVALPEMYYYGNAPSMSNQYINNNRKSMPDVQQAYLRSTPDYHLRKSASAISNEMFLPPEYRKSMPELKDVQMTSSNRSSYPAFNNRHPILPNKPLKCSSKDQREKERNNLISRPALHALSAVPKSRHIPNDNWVQMAKLSIDTKPKSNNAYNHHWLYHEAELQRLAEQNSKSKVSGKQEKHIPDPIIQTLTQRVQNRALKNDRKQLSRNGSQTYLNYPNNFNGHSSSSQSTTYPPTVTSLDDSQGKVLSISGKKKCSYCGNELGRGAAMIIESLCLFYHMECFKCCVCHAQLGDGLMGTDVRVRNQKLHCHNCYSSDDGVKFSCV